MTNEFKNLIQFSQKDLKDFREKLLKEQNNICPICKLKIDFSEAVVDHQHKLNKQQEVGENGAGLIRGVCCQFCNSVEGKTFNAFRRYGLFKRGVKFNEFVKNLAEYLSQPITNFVHPSERIKEPRLTKNSYKKLVKAINGKQKVPKFNEKRGQILTKSLKKLFEKYNIEPEYYK